MNFSSFNAVRMLTGSYFLPGTVDTRFSIDCGMCTATLTRI